MDLKITTLAERPELTEAMWRIEAWPEFMRRSVAGWPYLMRVCRTFPDYVLVATDEDGVVVARAHSVPFALAAPGRGTLPSGGWDQVLVWAFDDRENGVAPDTVSAIEVAIDPGHRGRGLSGRMLVAMRDNVRAHGITELVAPVRPSGKDLDPEAPIEEYAYRTREDGLPVDPWIRTHLRIGGEIHSMCTAAFVVAGSLAQWRAWTGLPFDTPGPVLVPDGITPALCVPEYDYAVYVEPNVWIVHR